MNISEEQKDQISNEAKLYRCRTCFGNVTIWHASMRSLTDTVRVSCAKQCLYQTFQFVTVPPIPEWRDDHVDAIKKWLHSLAQPNGCLMATCAQLVVRGEAAEVAQDLLAKVRKEGKPIVTSQQDVSKVSPQASDWPPEVEKPIVAWPTPIKHGPVVALEAVGGAEYLARAALAARADELLRFCCGLNMQDHPTSEQREMRRLTEELRKLLKEKRGEGA